MRPPCPNVQRAEGSRCCGRPGKGILVSRKLQLRELHDRTLRTPQVTGTRSQSTEMQYCSIHLHSSAWPGPVDSALNGNPVKGILHTALPPRIPLSTLSRALRHQSDFRIRICTVLGGGGVSPCTVLGAGVEYPLVRCCGRRSRRRRSSRRGSRQRGGGSWGQWRRSSGFRRWVGRCGRVEGGGRGVEGGGRGVGGWALAGACIGALRLLVVRRAGAGADHQGGAGGDHSRAHQRRQHARVAGLDQGRREPSPQSESHHRKLLTVSVVFAAHRLALRGRAALST